MSTRAPSGSAIQYEVVHRTTYEYSSPMADGYTLARLLPRDTAHQTVTRSELEVVPPPDETRRQADVFGNQIVQLGVHHEHAMLDLTARSSVELVPVADPGAGPRCPEVVAEAADLTGDEALSIRPFLAASPYVAVSVVAGAAVALLREFVDPDEAGVVDVARALSAGIRGTFRYDPDATEISTPLATVLAERHGVCQDFTHAAIAALRAIGLPARYVSGYLETTRPDGPQALVGADASHAWVSVWAGAEVGWLDFDPTNDLIPANRHVTVAWGRDYGDVAPVRGVVIGPPTAQVLSVAVETRRQTP